VRLFKLRRGEKAVQEQVSESETTYITTYPGIRIIPFTEEYRVIERYPLIEPFAYAVIGEHLETGNYLYFVDEPSLTGRAYRVYKTLLDYLLIEVPEIKVEAVSSYRELLEEMYVHVENIIRKYKLVIGELSDWEWATVLYYIIRDLIGYGPIEPVMRDDNIEDVSCDGVGKPIYVWHRKYESLPTNIVFESEEALDEFVTKLVHKSGRSVSVATPIVDAQLPDGSRLCVTYKREVSVEGSTFTIRKFRRKPFTFVELIQYGSISPEIAAYFWLLLEHKRSFLVIGVTGSGKTTLLNALATFIPPYMKIITVEEVPEINLPHEHWVRLVSRSAFAASGEKVAEITLFDLVKATLRMRPDYIIVGEIRGEEAFVLFQATSTGHGGISTMHAEDFHSAVRRLESPPMNIPPHYIPTMNVMLHIKRIKLGDRTVRRVVEVAEVISDREFNTVFKWNPRTDEHTSFIEKSKLLRDICEETGYDFTELLTEVYTRKRIIDWMVRNNISDFSDVAKVVTQFYRRREKVLKLVKL